MILPSAKISPTDTGRFRSHVYEYIVPEYNRELIAIVYGDSLEQVQQRRELIGDAVDGRLVKAHKATGLSEYEIDTLIQMLTLGVSKGKQRREGAVMEIAELIHEWDLHPKRFGQIVLRRLVENIRSIIGA